MEKVAQLPLLSVGRGEDLWSSAALRSRLETEILPAFLIRRRWYRSKTRKLTQVRIEAGCDFPAAGGSFRFAVLRAAFDRGGEERYALPLAIVPKAPPWDSILCGLEGSGGKQWVADALAISDFRAYLLETVLRSTEIPMDGGILAGSASRDSDWEASDAASSELAAGEQSNTAVLYPGYFLKLYRRLEEGIHPEVEILRFLAGKRYPHVPLFRAAWEWKRPGAPPVAVAVVQRRVEPAENGWDFVLGRLAGMVPQGGPIPEDLADWIRLLGRRTAGLHAVLGSASDDPAFAPEPFSPEDLAALRGSSSQLLNEARASMSGRSARTAVLRAAEIEMERLIALLSREPGGLGAKIRVHGDFHLGQVLKQDEDLWFLDFEGEPSRPPSERRRKHSPLRDVAGMTRSFHYAVHSALRGRAGFGNAVETGVSRALGGIFLEAYFEIGEGPALPPQKGGFRKALLDLLILEKAVYELHYELNHRPDWVEAPLRGLEALTQA